jgi:hypothetical protein
VLYRQLRNGADYLTFRPFLTECPGRREERASEDSDHNIHFLRWGGGAWAALRIFAQRVHNGVGVPARGVGYVSALYVSAAAVQAATGGQGGDDIQ